jgi:hypothetical protein
MEEVRRFVNVMASDADSARRALYCPTEHSADVGLMEYIPCGG